MIPILLAAAMAIAIFVLLLYAAIDNDNRVYGNVVACIIAGILSLVLGSSIAAGGVRDYTAGGTYYVVQDSVLPWLLGAIGMVAFVVAAFFIVDAVMEHLEPDEEEEELTG